MQGTSFLIAARQEKYLETTIRDVLKNCRGEIEILVALDGYVPDPQIVLNDNRVTFYHFPESIGQRQCINFLAKQAKGKYICKMDAHVAIDEGFDVKLAADCEPSWTIIPRMYNLDVETWKPKLNKRTDYMYITGPSTAKPFRAAYYTGREYRKWHSKPELIDDTLCCMGPCWFMHKDRFFAQDGCDELHGGWGAMSVEVALKAWLSGGALKVNKNTWFAHWFRGDVGFPYPISGKQVEKARKHSRDLWLNDKWDKATRKLSWVIEKFNPPGWKANDLTILFYTSNVISKKILEPVMRSLKRHNIPIVSVSQEPMDLGVNIVVPKERSLQNIYKQVLIGAKKATTEYVALCEDDCLYVPEHFSFRPKTFGYNLNRWLLHLDENIFSYRKRPILSQCIANREVLIKNLEERLALKSIPDEYCGEMGCFEKQLGMTEYPYETFETKDPNLVVCHNKNIMGRKYLGKDAEPKAELDPWGDVNYWVSKFTSLSGYEQRHIKIQSHKQHSHIAGKSFEVDHLIDNLEHYWDWRKKGRFPKYKSSAFQFYKDVHEGKQFTDEELKATPYYKYVLSRFRPETQDSKVVLDRALFKVKEGISIYHDIKQNGFHHPIDMWMEHGKLNLYRGSRKIIIAKLLGYKSIPVRIFNSNDLLMKFLPDCTTKIDNSINGLAMKQFAKYQDKATDKYWIHNYTPIYDTHFSAIRETARKVLEIGVKHGASLLLWREVFANSEIYGVDKDTSKAMMVKGVDRVTLLQGLQEDEDFLKNKVVPCGKFDIIIDDGGHRSRQQKPTFEILWNSLYSNGFYVIEDLYHNYLEDKDSNCMKMLKDKIDELNLKSEIKAMHFYYNICFIQKR